MNQAVGQVAPVSSSHEWKIENFSAHTDLDRGKSVDSPILRTFCQDAKSSNDTVVLQWRLGMYPNGHTSKDTGKSKYVSICLESCNNFEVETKYSLEIVGVHSYNNIIKSNSEGKVFKANGASWGWEFAKKEAVLSKYSGLLINDTLTISCSIFGTRIVDRNFETRGGSSEAFDYFEQLMLSGDLSDVTFAMGEMKMRLHKNILSSVSPIFRAMFKDEKRSVVDIEDVEVNVMMELLRYAYARKVKGIEKIAAELFVAAEKYRVKELAVLCEETLCDEVSADTAFNLLEVAVKYNMTILKDRVVGFIMANLTDLVKKNEFNKLSPDVKDELLGYVANMERKGY